MQRNAGLLADLVVVVHDFITRQHCNVIILHNDANSVLIHRGQTTLLRPTGSQE